MRLKGRNAVNSYQYISIFLALFIVTFFVSFIIGRYPIDIISLLRIFLSRLFPMSKTWNCTIEAIIFQIRLPRILGAALVGASLSISGAVYQGMFKNPLVSPDILGASAGAAFGASLAIYLSLNTIGIQLSAFIFGVVGVMMVYLISLRINEDPLISLVIIGILVGSIFTSFTSLIKYLADTKDKLPSITFWLMGSLSSIKLRDIKAIFLPIAMGIGPLYALRWKLNILSLGEDEAKTMGLDTGKIRAIVIICSTLLTATSVSISGVIGWIGLVIPNLSRILVGPDYRILLPVSILLGGSYLLLVDNIARSIITVEIPLGILTSLIGAPFFVFLLLNRGS
ncbi:MAG TPA: iron ABC transporter permease [Tepidimicrobium sp.]|nr:iron ABC transporter permease [Tepidimicrobium sp.]